MLLFHNPNYQLIDGKHHIASYWVQGFNSFNHPFGGINRDKPKQNNVMLTIYQLVTWILQPSTVSNTLDELPNGLGMAGLWVLFNIQWEFQDPKMEVLYHIRPYFGGISPYIGLKNRPYIW